MYYLHVLHSLPISPPLFLKDADYTGHKISSALRVIQHLHDLDHLNYCYVSRTQQLYINGCRNLNQEMQPFYLTTVIQSWRAVVNLTKRRCLRFMPYS